MLRFLRNGPHKAGVTSGKHPNDLLTLTLGMTS